MERQALSSVSSPMFDVEVLQAQLPVLVEFGAVWCPPCRVMEQHLRALDEDDGGSLLVRKVDVDTDPELADRYEIRNLPTMLLFRDGHVVGRVLGAVPLDKLRDFVAAATGRAA